MMEGFLHHYKGGGLWLREFLSWKMTYTGGVPCDAFTVKCPWEGEGVEVLSGGSEFTAYWEGDVVFRGVVDEFEVSLTESGRILTLSGRGMAARLLDNEALGSEYQTATIGDILRDHVTLFGVEVVQDSSVTFPRVSGFSVDTGSSAWQVVYQYGLYCAGVTPRFDREGVLHLAPWGDGERMVVDGNTPVISLVYREKRYGVISEMLVRDKTRQAVETVRNEEFLAVGGSRRQVVTMPGASSTQAMRYSGEFQIEQSMEDWVKVEVEMPFAFGVWPGDLVEIAREDCGFNGVYRVCETCVEVDGKGKRTWMELGVL